MSEIPREITRDIQEADAKPERCPWCGYSGMFDKHAPKKHPDKWREWKNDHKQVKVSRIIWVKQ